MIKRLLLKLSILVFCFTPYFIGITNAVLNNSAVIENSQFSTSDWTPPSIPGLISPANNSFRNTDDLIMDWTGVSDYADINNPAYYIYQNACSPEFLPPAYQSDHLSSSSIPAPEMPEGEYWWRVKACDSIDNCSNWSEVWHVTVDNAPPVILDISVDTSETMALINWTTDELATSQIEYGTDTAHGSFTPEDSALLTAHAEVLTGLTADTLYHFRIHSTDAAGNKAISDDQIFTTNAHSVLAGDVVVNEVYYDAVQSGADDSYYEWIELYNNTGSDIVLENWSLANNGSSDAIPTVTLSANGFAVIAATSGGFSANFSGASGSPIVYIIDGEIGDGLDNDGDRVILRDSLNNEIDAVSWGNDDYVFGSGNGVIPLTGDGGSIARNPLGEDNDIPGDWEVLSIPNPGHNPHGHISVDLKQGSNNLLVLFTNAGGFNQLKYQVNYKHIFEGGDINELIQGEADKDMDENELELEPIYFGTCSNQGIVCLPHAEISGVEISLMYKKDQQIIGVSNLEFDWKNN